jgi:hypothetical protein
MFANENSKHLMESVKVIPPIGALQLRPQQENSSTSSTTASVQPQPLTSLHPIFIPYIDRFAANLQSSILQSSVSFQLNCLSNVNWKHFI